MSVILFSHQDFQEMADAYEGLKHLLPYSNLKEEDYTFYKSLRRLHFANVATYLCQYHDDSPLSEEELKHIDPFIGLEGHNNPILSNQVKMKNFLDAWGGLKYNLITNDGEHYEAKEAYAYMNSLAARLSREVIARLVNNT